MRAAPPVAPKLSLTPRIRPTIELHNAIAMKPMRVAFRYSDIARSSRDHRGDVPLEAVDNGSKLVALRFVERLQGRPHAARAQACQFASRLDGLDELATFEEVHQRQHRGHDPAALVEVLLD